MLARISITMVVALGLLVDATSARADDDARTETAAAASAAATAERQRDYYGEQVIAADVASLLAGLAISESEGAIVGVTGYALGGPIIHAIHRNYGTAATSLGLRVGLPITSAYMGLAVYHLQHEHEDWDVLAYMGMGLVVGTVTAAVVDWAVLGWTDRPAPGPEGRAYVLVPRVAVGESGVSLGVQGSF